MKKSLNTLLLVAFALLQSVAPLVHAHVNGEQSGVLPPVFELVYHAGNELSQADCFIAATDSPAINLSHEFHRDSQPALPSPGLTRIVEPALVGFAIFPSIEALRFSSFLPYSRAHAQAPPISA